MVTQIVSKDLREFFFFTENVSLVQHAETLFVVVFRMLLGKRFKLPKRLSVHNNSNNNRVIIMILIIIKRDEDRPSCSSVDARLP